MRNFLLASIIGLKKEKKHGIHNLYNSDTLHHVRVAVRSFLLLFLTRLHPDFSVLNMCRLQTQEQRNESIEVVK